MPARELPTRYRIRWQADDADRVVLAGVDTGERIIRCELPGGQAFTADVVTARAIPMLLSHIVYSVLAPDGPYLWIEAQRYGRWLDLRSMR